MDLETYYRKLSENKFIPVPPDSLMFVGGSSEDFRAIGVSTLRSLIKNCHLAPTHKVLDIGSGVGRIALPLTQWLDKSGEYLGIEVVADGVRWCERHISSLYPNFRFMHADVYNEFYNPAGRSDVGAMRLDAPDRYFDLAIFSSVFTHLLVEDTAAYFALIRRHLAVGARLWASWFLIDGHARVAIGRGASSMGFMLAQGAATFHCAAPASPAAAVAYELALVRGLYAQHGFEIELERMGNWCDRPTNEGGGYQDLIVARLAG